MNSLHQFAFLVSLGSGTSLLQELPCSSTFTLSPCSSVMLCACVHSLWLSNTSVSGPLALFHLSHPTPTLLLQKPLLHTCIFKYTQAKIQNLNLNPQKLTEESIVKCSWVLFVFFVFFKVSSFMNCFHVFFESISNKRINAYVSKVGNLVLKQEHPQSGKMNS